jgi:hypothetical protein
LITLKKLKLKIEKKFRTTFSMSALHNQVRLLGYSNITGRPQHYKQDKEKLEDFKKTLRTCLPSFLDSDFDIFLTLF